MKNFRINLNGHTRRAWTLFGACALTLAFLILSHGGQAQQQQTQQDSRPRRVDPSASPTPPKLTTQPSSQTPGANPSATPADPDGVELDEGDTIKVDTNLVNLNVRVIDRNNRTFNDVRQDEFRIYEDGVLQKIEFASKEEVPISYGLAIDTSGSLRSQLPQVIEAGKTIVDSNKEGDETFLVTFTSSDKIETIVDFTPNKNELKERIDELYVNSGQTAVVDAVYLSAERVAQYKKSNDSDDRRRRALIIVTDGEDRDSYYKQEQLFARLREDDVQIYIIGFVNELEDEKSGIFIRKSHKSRAVDLLNRMAKETGGRAFFPASLSELPGIATEITRDMRTQYVIGYYPTNERKDGTYRAIRVTIGDATGRDKRIAITRSGRTAPREGGAPVTPAPKPAPSRNVKPATTGRKP
ncbi:MAG: VWA domain-containing protein [Pyrinomonadaceae bacterium]|nr:VWA domain-containing protein [Pyrinomonadaceae bacterium]